jgi:integrase
LDGNITAEEARRLAKKAAGRAVDGDPVADRKAVWGAPRKMVDAVLDAYLEEPTVKGLRSFKAISRAFARHVRPHIGKLSIYQLKRSHIADMLTAIATASGPSAADRTLDYLSAAFNWQIVRDDQFTSPIVRGMKRVKPSEQQRDRVLDDDEIRDLFEALDALHDMPKPFQATPNRRIVSAPSYFREYIKTLLLTAARRANVAMMHRDEIDQDGWEIPAAKFKGKRKHFVPLSATVRALLATHDGYIFSDDGKTPMGGFSKPKLALDTVLAEVRKRNGRKPMKPWTYHDLRRTAETRMAKCKVPQEIIDKVVGHKLDRLRGTYNKHDYLDEKRDALTKLAAHITGLTTPPEDSKVVKLRR